MGFGKQPRSLKQGFFSNRLETKAQVNVLKAMPAKINLLLATAILLGMIGISLAVDTQCNGQANGTPCNDNNPDTTNDQCENDVCTGTDINAQCADPDSEGNACDDGNPQTTDDVCHNGVCAGTCPVPLQLIARECVPACPVLADVQNAAAYDCNNAVSSPFLPFFHFFFS